MMKNVLQDDVSLSSVNFYLKNTKKDYRDELKSLVMSKMNNITQSDKFWQKIEDIFEYI